MSLSQYQKASTYLLLGALPIVDGPVIVHSGGGGAFLRMVSGCAAHATCVPERDLAKMGSHETATYGEGQIAFSALGERVPQYDVTQLSHLGPESAHECSQMPACVI